MQETMDYPTRLEVDYPESPSRVLALLGVIFFLKWLLLIPHLIVILILLGIANASLSSTIGYWAVLITGSYPAEACSGSCSASSDGPTGPAGGCTGFTDSYPPFTLGMAEDYGSEVQGRLPGSAVEMAGPSGSAPLLPQADPADPSPDHPHRLGTRDDLSSSTYRTGRCSSQAAYPRGLFDFAVGVKRWSTRTDSWFIGFTDRYPPFSLS